MIRKFFIIGKQLYLQSKSVESYNDLGTVIELYLPIEDFWKIEDMLKEANYLLANNISPGELLNFYKKVFLRASKFAVREKERNWLYDKATKD